AYRVLSGQDQQVLQELGRPQKQYSPLYFDVGVLENTPIPLIYTLNKVQIIQLFYAEDKNNITIYILDERGSLYSQNYNKSNVGQLLNRYRAFLEAILMRNLHETLLTLEYYEIQKNSKGVLSCVPVQVKVAENSAKLTLRISGEISNDKIIYTAYCNDQEFSSVHYGNQVFNAVYQYILQFRSEKLEYPLYISDIDLPLAAFHIASQDELQTIHYLNYKKKIEARLNF
ncbi:MAG: adenylate cyclase, partial [Methylococcales bacterium]